MLIINMSKRWIISVLDDNVLIIIKNLMTLEICSDGIDVTTPYGTKTFKSVLFKTRKIILVVNSDADVYYEHINIYKSNRYYRYGRISYDIHHSCFEDIKNTLKKYG